MQSAPAAQSFPAMMMAAESLLFVLSGPTIPIAPPAAIALGQTQVALELTAPRGPPRAFAALRAPPVFS